MNVTTVVLWKGNDFIKIHKKYFIMGCGTLRDVLSNEVELENIIMTVSHVGAIINHKQLFEVNSIPENCQD